MPTTKKPTKQTQKMVRKHGPQVPMTKLKKEKT